MKKTLLLLALAVSAGFAYADSDDTTDKTLVFSNTAAAASSNLDGGSYNGVIFTLSNTPSRLNATFPAAPELTEIPTFTSYELQSVSVMIRGGDYSVSSIGSYIIDDVTNTVLALSTSIVSGSGGDTITFNFSDLTLQANTTYRLMFLAEDEITNETVQVGSVAPTGAFHSQQLAAYGSGNLPESTATECGFSKSDFDTIGTAGYAPVVTITAIIPEPATATLSLLALAGLAARRRRH